MSRGVLGRRALQVAGVGLLAALCGALHVASGRGSSALAGALGIGGAVIMVAIAAAAGRDLLARLARRVPCSRPAIRVPVGIAPWLALSVAATTRSLWWAQRPWELKFFALYIATAWAVVWFTAGRDDVGAASEGEGTIPDAATDRAARHVLVGFACVLLVVGADGLVLGGVPFGVATSAIVALLGVVVAALCAFAGPVGRGRALAASFGLIVGLAGVEAGVRMLRFGENLREVDTFEIARRFYSLTPPGSTFVNWPRALDEFQPALIEINSMGIRGPEIPSGPVDLLLIGDSMIEARQLPWEQTLAPRLQAALERRAVRARVVSHGMRGWSPLLEWNWYLKVGRELHPRVVLLFFFWNDLWASGDEVRTFQAVLSPNGRPEHFDVPVDSHWVWYKHVRTVRVAADMIRRVGLTTIKRAVAMLRGTAAGGRDLASARALAKQMAGDSLFTAGQLDALLSKPSAELDPKLRQLAATQLWGSLRPLDRWNDEQRRAAAVTELELQRFAEDVASDGGRLVVVYVPNPYQISTTECSVARYLEGLDDGYLLPPDSGIQAWLRGVGDRRAIEVLDPSQAMRDVVRAQAAAAPSLYLRADCHLSERGHQFMADFLADWYTRQHQPAR